MKMQTYKIYDYYGKAYPDIDWDAKIARTKFKELMQVKQERLFEIEQLLLKNDVKLDYSVESLTSLNKFICSELDEYKPKLDKNDPYCCEYAETSYFRSLAIDATLYLGEILIKTDPDFLKWSLFKTNSKRLVYRHYPSVNNALFSTSIYLYIMRYLLDLNNEKDRFIFFYEEALMHFKRLEDKLKN